MIIEAILIFGMFLIIAWLIAISLHAWKVEQQRQRKWLLDRLQNGFSKAERIRAGR